MKIKYILYALIFFFCPGFTIASEDILIQVQLFQGKWSEGRPGLEQTEILSKSTHPELSFFNDPGSGSETALTAAVITALLDIYDLQTIDDLFFHEKPWNGQGKPLIKDMLLGDPTSFEVKMTPEMLPSLEVVLHMVISLGKINRANLAGDFETIIDQELVLEMGNQLIVSVPCQSGGYFMMVNLTTGIPQENKPESNKSEKIRLVTAPNPIHKIQPFYPEALRRRRMGGKIGLLITIDKQGIVQWIEVVRALHPYQNYSAVQAFRKWTFEPVFSDGKSVPAKFVYIHEFNPWYYLQEREWSETHAEKPGSFSQAELARVLAGGGEYCRSLSDAVFDFICHETIKETHYNLQKNISWRILATSIRDPFDVGSNPFSPKSDVNVVWKIQIIDPQRTLRNNYFCDYQIIKKSDSIKEQRIVLKENGRKSQDQKNLLEETRFSGVSSLFAPIRVLAKDRQPLFDYRIVEERKVFGRRTHVIEATPKFGKEGAVWSAGIWVDKQNFQVLKCEIEGIPINGYEDVLNDCAILNIKPIFKSTHEYGVERNNIRFPSRSEIQVAYPGIDQRGAVVKISMRLTYKNFKFFTVETDHQVIKK